jgi:hypothetical protein
MDIILICSYDDLEDSEIETLKSQEVDFDDWNIMVFFPLHACEEVDDDVEEYNEDRNFYYMKPIKVLKPKDYYAQRIIENGALDAKWYSNISFRGQTWCLGVQHH